MIINISSLNMSINSVNHIILKKTKFISNLSNSLAQYPISYNLQSIYGD